MDIRLTAKASIGLFYDLSSGRLKRIYYPHVLDCETGSAENVRRGIRERQRPGEGVVIIPAHQRIHIRQILAGLGVKTK